MDENGEQFVAYFIPTPEARAKRRADEEQDIPYQEDEESVSSTYLHVYSLLLHVYQHVVKLPACGHHCSLFRSLEFPNG